jgi:hypothetical protein
LSPSHTAELPSGANWPNDAAHFAGGNTIPLDGTGGIYNAGSDSANIPSVAMPTGDFEVKIGFKDYGSGGTQSQIMLTLFDDYTAGFNGATGLVRFSDDGSQGTPGWALRIHGTGVVSATRYTPAAGTTVIFRVRATGRGSGTITLTAAYSTDGGANFTDAGLTINDSGTGNQITRGAAIGPYFSASTGNSNPNVGLHFLGPMTIRNYP